MRKFYVALAMICTGFATQAQTDSTKTPAADTIRIGSMIIIKKGDGKYDNGEVKINRRTKKNENVSTNWFIVDLGFSNFSDKTNYSALQTSMPGINEDWFNLRNGKSTNVNIWIFMQRLNMIEHVVNLKYGMGLELNNYRYTEKLRYDKNTSKFYLDAAADNNYTKNKLAADYLTIPLMLNFNFTPKNDNSKSFGFSAGVSGGYLYSSRQKTITSKEGKEKLHDDFDLQPFKLSYIAELQLGPIKLYGSVASKNMFKKNLDQTPFNIGFRLSNW
jgi:hypothetical protein